MEGRYKKEEIAINIGSIVMPKLIQKNGKNKINNQFTKKKEK